MKKIISLSLVLAAVVILGGCSLYGPTQNNTGTMPTTGATAAGNAVNIQNFSFNPPVLTVTKGTTVTWTNNDSVTHQIKSDTFNSSGLTNGQTFSFTFTNSGSFDYSCAIHPSMTGKIVVE
jgi:plastocyanin